MPVRVKCLHALLAQTLVMGEGANPIGDMALSAIKHEFDPGRMPLRSGKRRVSKGEEAMKSVTVAGIDCGTNSIRLKVSRVSEDGVEDIVPRILRVIRLGQDVDKTHRFADEALARAYAAAREFAERACRTSGGRHPLRGHIGHP